MTGSGQLTPAGAGVVKAGPLVSVIIPAYNAQAHLAECLASVSGQVHPFDLEIIVVDDGSADATAEIARRTAGVQCITQPNRGPSAARNVGIGAARGEFIAFLDADDLWPPDKLQAQVRLLQQHPELALAFGDCRQFSAQGPRPRTEFQANRLGPLAWGPGPAVPSAYARLLEVNFITTGSVVVRREVLQEVGGFAEDLRLVEDLDLWLRIAHRHPIGWCGQECLLRRRHSDNISRDAEAIGLAYLEVLARHAATWQPGEAAALGVDAGRLASREYLNLAELARLSGKPGTAWSYLWHSLAAHPGPRTLWRVAKVAAKLLAGGAAVR
ncbi:MAG: glycosyltransferase [Rubrivivax sp.]|nr:glycosyltransferase [Rubrivivax sp.]